MSFDSNKFISEEQRERERQERLDRAHPLSTAHGQDGGGFDSFDIDGLFSNSDSSNCNSGFGEGARAGSCGSSGLGTNNNQSGGFTSGFGLNPTQQQSTHPQRQAEDILFDVVKKSSTGVFGFAKE